MPEGPLKLVSLDVNEVSGVDEAANLYRGWLLMKSKGGDASVTKDQIEQLLEKAEAHHSELRKLDESLHGAKDPLLEAPDEIKKAAERLSAYVNHVLEGKELEVEETEKAGNNATKIGFLARAIARFIEGTSGEAPAPKEAEKEEIDGEAWGRLCSAVAAGSTEGGK